MDVDSEATADLDLDNEQDDVVGSYAVTNPDPLTLSTGAGISESAPPSKADEADYGPEEDDAATESEGDNKQDAGMPAPKPVASRRYGGAGKQHEAQHILVATVSGGGAQL